MTDKSKLPIKGKIRKIGNSYAITIPMQYIKAEFLIEGKEYSGVINGESL